MTREEKIICKDFLNDADKTHSCNEYKLLMALLEQDSITKNVSLEAYKQVAWERDIAIQQLHELGYEFGQKIEPTTKNNLAVDCVSRKAVLDITWQDPSYADPLNVLTEVRDKVRELPPVTPQEPILDKIIAEIEEIETYDGLYVDRAYVLQILDKYKAESEG